MQGIMGSGMVWVDSGAYREWHGVGRCREWHGVGSKG